MSSLKNIPPIDEVIKQPRVQQLVEKYNREYILTIARQAAGQLRDEIRKNQIDIDRDQATELILARVEDEAFKSNRGKMKRVVNGTGVVLHTNLGRAPLSERAAVHVAEMGRYYSNLELDLEKGERGSRYQHVEDLLVSLTGAEAALVVNNNAAAVLLGLTSFAQGKEVIVSRGQLIEIGGAFRIPEVMKQSGAYLVEVGTTNRTYPADFEKAINENTAMLFTAHTSNYKVMGFVREVGLNELVQLGKKYNVPVMQDLGSGCLLNLGEWGLLEEPNVPECVASGADIVCFSGDKLLGGSQAGILVGKKHYIDAMKKNQLLRALRIDKLTLAALEMTLLEYHSGQPSQNLPVINMLSRSPEELQGKARRMLRGLHRAFKGDDRIAEIELCTVFDTIGGGAYPTYEMPGYGVQIEFSNISIETAAKNLRLGDPAMLVRKQDDRLIISARTVFEDEIKLLPGLFAQAMNRQ
ncbi:MAG: L-seryl-tRNA(Sec) selenium transferase [Syntrophomonas sp.]